ncbi:PepSY domain-containing protein [Bowmanella dokdonensis]|uniref:PepSY domain-containing protein n=1 Tax=Bowmanella dokdonensis TaxID=751969 RepID=A0A939DM05_9ALTE|nr:PepSY domain-containing protein [Bowmanella dokdonensis]MBN7824605.1 PepSY domain-containing protein [Bowmanella dokdonensis]
MKCGKTLILLVLSCCLTWAVQAQDQDQLDEAQAAKRARQQVDGRVLKVDRKKDNYRVKVLQKSGRVVTVDVDKHSGKVSKRKDKDEKR